MEHVEKIAYLKNMLKPDTPSDDELTALLYVTKGAILNARYPFGYEGDPEVPLKYEHIQMLACITLWNKKGAEGQTSHTENGIARTYEAGDIPETLLKKIMPLVGSVTPSEKS